MPYILEAGQLLIYEYFCRYLLFAIAIIGSEEWNEYFRCEDRLKKQLHQVLPTETHSHDACSITAVPISREGGDRGAALKQQLQFLDLQYGSSSEINAFNHVSKKQSILPAFESDYPPQCRLHTYPRYNCLWEIIVGKKIKRINFVHPIFSIVEERRFKERRKMKRTSLYSRCPHYKQLRGHYWIWK